VKTAPKVAPVAAKALKNPKAVKPADTKKVSPAALTQTATKKPAAKKK
jgi:hypothetical protein